MPLLHLPPLPVNRKGFLFANSVRAINRDRQVYLTDETGHEPIFIITHR